MMKIRRAIVIGIMFLPLTGLLVGNGSLAFTMYASSVWFRLDILARGADGRARAIAPTLLAQKVTPSALPFLAGSDHFRRTYDISALRNHLGDVARLACDDDAVRVEVTLFERSGDDWAIYEQREHVTCAK